MNMSKKLTLIILFSIIGCAHSLTPEVPIAPNPVKITEWLVPWEQTRPRDPYVDQYNLVWFVGQAGDYVAVLDPESGKFKQYPLAPGTGPHNVIMNDDDFAWYAGNRASHVGKLDPATGDITKYAMPDPSATDPHTLVFGKNNEIWFTVQQGNFIGHLAMGTGDIRLTPLPTPQARPYGIVVDAAHVPWFTEFGTNKLGTIDLATQSIREISLPRSDARPRRLAITSHGVIWYVDHAKGFLGEFTPATGKFEEWTVPGGENAYPYALSVDDQDRVWFVETGPFPNRLVGFDTRTKKVISITDIKSGGGTVRNMFYHQPKQTLWFGTDANTIARAQLP